MIAGVCSGIALRLNVDPTLVRVVTAVLTVVTGGVAAIGYGLLWVALPVAGEGSTGGTTATSSGPDTA